MVQAQGWVELYVRGRLSAADSAAFENHYFHCDQCFAEVQEMDRFVSGLQDAGERGLLGVEREGKSRHWLVPALTLAAAVSVLLAAALVYTTLVRLPRVEAELGAARAKSSQSAAQLAELNRSIAVAAAPEANVPVVVLSADRSASAPGERLSIHGQSGMVLLWIDIPPQPSGARFRIDMAANGAPVKAIRGLERNGNGALAAAVPAKDLPAGVYVVRLYSEQAPGVVVAEYRMRVARD